MLIIVLMDIISKLVIFLAWDQLIMLVEEKQFLPSKNVQIYALNNLHVNHLSVVQSPTELYCNLNDAPNPYYATPDRDAKFCTKNDFCTSPNTNSSPLPSTNPSSYSTQLPTINETKIEQNFPYLYVNRFNNYNISDWTTVGNISMVSSSKYCPSNNNDDNKINKLNKKFCVVNSLNFSWD
eukprot:109320_1